MTNVNIVDNFLSNKDFDNINKTMLSSFFPWFVNKTTTHYNDDDLDTKELTHIFYRDYSINSENFKIIYPILKNINPISLIRIRAALMPRKEQQNLKEKDYHVDNNFNCTTGIYYVNTNNGYTIFKDGTKIKSIANRFIFFNSNIEHAGTFCTDQDFRCIINFNYFC